MTFYLAVLFYWFAAHLPHNHNINNPIKNPKSYRPHVLGNSYIRISIKILPINEKGTHIQCQIHIKNHGQYDGSGWEAQPLSIIIEKNKRKINNNFFIIIFFLW